MDEMQKGKITILDVAEALGVSKTTVSRAISGKGRIGAETREKVLRYINEHNYTPSAIAKGLAQSRTFNVSWVVPGDYSIAELPFFQNCLLGISDMASAMEYDIIISMVSNQDISQLKRAIANHKIDGAILSRTLKNDMSAMFLQEAKIPFVAIGLSELENVVQIDNDHLSGCKELTSLLILKGCKNIGVIGGNSTHMVTQKRLSGFMEGCEDAGTKHNMDMIYLDVEGQSRTEKAVEELLDKKADCIICMDDSICGYALNKLKMMNVRIPEDIKLASFYDSAMLDLSTPAITTLKFDAEELGREAFKLLYEMIEERTVKEKTLLGYDIVLKESTK